MSSDLLIYGSNGYTGELILERALAEGARPILAGRTRDKIETQAALSELEFRIFSLDEPEAIDEGLKDIKVVINCAGPFSRTAIPMAAACIRAGAHYLDITGEIQVFEDVAAMSEAAKKAGVMLMPGTGFDVVPSDCLAAHLKKRLPGATDSTPMVKRPSPSSSPSYVPATEKRRSDTRAASSGKTKRDASNATSHCAQRPSSEIRNSDCSRTVPSAD